MEIRFDDVTIDVDRQVLHRDGELVAVQPTVLDVLVHLIRHRDRVVSKEELLDEVWTHRSVTESALTSRIKSARQAIGDNGREQRLTRTVHGRGYRFVPLASVTDPAQVVFSIAEVLGVPRRVGRARATTRRAPGRQGDACWSSTTSNSSTPAIWWTTC